MRRKVVPRSVLLNRIARRVVVLRRVARLRLVASWVRVNLLRRRSPVALLLISIWPRTPWGKSWRGRLSRALCGLRLCRRIPTRQLKMMRMRLVVRLKRKNWIPRLLILLRLRVVRILFSCLVWLVRRRKAWFGRR